MRLPFPYAPTIAFLVAAVALPAAAADGEPLEVAVRPTGSAAAGRPLPLGATVSITVTLKNGGKDALGPIELTARFDGLAPVKPESWRADGGTLKSEIPSIAAGASAERTVRLRVETAPLEPAGVRVAAEAKLPDGTASSGETEIRVADCAGAYRARLAALRDGLTQPARDKADEMRKADASLPAGRLFPATGARSGELARAERLAGAFAARRGADPQMSTEWFRYMIARFASELNAYAGQAANPGLCANNYYQIAGYRQGLLPITKHLDATRTAAEAALDAARKEAAMETAGVAELARALAREAQAEGIDENAGALAVLAGVRGVFAKARPGPGLSRKLSLAETAAWLAETDERGRALVQAIDGALGEISKAHKETCVCAF